MDDLISRNALFREMEKAQWYNNADRDEIAEELVLNAQTIESEPRWIPCSERLPDKECFVLVTVNDGAIYTDLSLFRHDGRFIEHTGDVVAWMPLPEPYKERREDAQQRR